MITCTFKFIIQFFYKLNFLEAKILQIVDFIERKQIMNESFSYLLPDEHLKSIKIQDTAIIDYQNGNKKRKVYENVQYDQQELRQIQSFRIYAEGKEDLQKVSDATIIRYLYSFDFKHEESLQKLRIFLEWYSNPKIQRFDNITLELINQGVCYTYGRDKHFRPIIYLNVALIDMTKYCLDDYLSAINAIVTLVIEKLYIKGKVQNYLFIIDTQNKNFTSLPLTAVKQMVQTLSYVYSMRMGKLLIVNCNYLVKFMYSAIVPFISEITRQKINLLSRSEVEDGKMKEYIDKDQLQQKYTGAKSNLVQKWPPQIPGRQTNKMHKQFESFELFQDPNRQDPSQYYSCQNNQEIFYQFDENGQKIVVMQGCCAPQQCTIY